MLLLILSALIMGASLGLLGGGGAIITVPALVYGAKLPPKEAIATALGIVAITAAVSGFREWRAGRVHFKKAIPFSLSGMVGSFLAAKAASLWLSEDVQMILFALVVLVAGGAMVRSALKKGMGESRERSLVILVAAGLGVGVMSGLLGVGGGFLIVPALVLVAGMDMKSAVANSLVVIAMNSVTGALGYLGRVDMHWKVALLFGVAGVLGSVGGTSVRHWVPEKQLRLGFSVFLFIMGAYIGARYLFPQTLNP